MSDTTKVAATEATAEAAEVTQEVTAKETDWKAEARKWEQRAKDNSTAAARLTEIEEASKSEAQKLADRAAAAEAKAAAYEAREQIAGWKAEVSKETGVPAALLAGSTREEIEAHAAIAAPLIATPQAPAVPIVPTEGTKGNAGSGASQLTVEDLKTLTPDQVNEARRSGRLNRVLGIN